MSLKIITDSTCDLTLQELKGLDVVRVPLTVHFKGKGWLDWEEITPRDIIEGVQAGADLPSTSQPSPEAFAQEYRAAVEAGATEILVVTISSELSGTYQSAVLASQDAGVPVIVFDSRAASIGSAHMVRKASELREAGLTLGQILPSLEQIRDTNFVLFSVGGLDFLHKGGRMGKATAVLGGLLNIKPILSMDDGKIAAVGRARGTKKALAEMVRQTTDHAGKQNGRLHLNYLHVQDPAAAQRLKDAVDAAGIKYSGGTIYEIGAVIAAHVGPGTTGLYMYTEPGDHSAAVATAEAQEPVAA